MSSVNIDCIQVDDDGEDSLSVPGTPEVVGTKGMRTCVTIVFLFLCFLVVSHINFLPQIPARSTQELFRNITTKSKRIGRISIYSGTGTRRKTRCKESRVEISGNQARRTLA